MEVRPLLVEGVELRLQRDRARQGLLGRVAGGLDLREAAEGLQEQGGVVVPGDGGQPEPEVGRGRLAQSAHVAGHELVVGGHVAGLDVLAGDGEDGRGPGAGLGLWQLPAGRALHRGRGRA